jgi:hypothetical protein
MVRFPSQSASSDLPRINVGIIKGPSLKQRVSTQPESKRTQCEQITSALPQRAASLTTHSCLYCCRSIHLSALQN